MIRRDSQALSARASASRRHLVVRAVGIDACRTPCRCRARVVAVDRRPMSSSTVRPGVDTPARQTMPVGAVWPSTCGDDGGRRRAFDHDVGRELGQLRAYRCAGWRRDRAPAPASARSSLRSSTWTSRPRCTPISAASSPIGPAAGHQHGLRLPRARAPADPFDLVPRLGDDARRLQQDAEHGRAQASTLTAKSGSMRNRSAP